MNRLVLYARKIPTTDEVWHKHQTDKSVVPTDVELKDGEGNVKAIIPWHHANKPDRRYKYKMLNCYLFRLVWID